MPKRWFVPVRRGAFSERQLRLVSELAVGDERRDGVNLAHGEHGLPGPFEALLRTPRLGIELARIGGRFETQSVLPPLVREMVILLVASRLGSRFEWTAHEAKALELGIRQEQLQDLVHGKLPRGLAKSDAAVLELASALVAGGQVSEDLRLDTLSTAGEEAAVETAILVGYYELIAHVLVVGGR